MSAVMADKLLTLQQTCAHLGVSRWWLRENASKSGFPRRVEMSPKKIGYWQSELDAWRRRPPT